MNDTDQLDEMPGANMNTRDVHQHLKKRGWSLSRSSGGHDVYTHAKSDKHIAVPRHKQLKAPLVMGILKTAKMVSEENDTMEKNEMAQTQLHFIEYASKEILDYISMGGEIEEWYQNKLSKVHSDMEGLHSYIEGEKRRTGMTESHLEEADQIDELKTSTLTRYGTKAVQSLGQNPEKTYKRVKGIQTARYKVQQKYMKKENFEQLEEGRPSQRHPLEDHEYHRKSNDELIRIAKDAHKAAEAMKSHNTTAENKYRDQANDSATVRYFRQKNGMPTWYKKKYGHMNESMDITNESDAAWEKAKEKEKRDALTNKDRGTLDKVRAMIAKEKKPVQEQHSLDEISKRTLGSYIKKANDQSRYDANRVGYVAGKSTKPYNDSEESSLEKKRASGIAKATDRLTKEDVDLDEATGDVKFDMMMKKVAKAPTAKERNAERIRQKRERQEDSRKRSANAFGTSPADKLSIRNKSVTEESGKSRKSEIIRDALKSAKTKNEKKVNSNKTDKFEADPELGDTITRTDQ
jgi:predicted RNA binding protein YcfA (HicA-like mRNA interferase family)